jgi:4-alpha-glucanotransferase
MPDVFAPLRKLAESYGIQTEFQDATRQQRPATPEALLRVLQALAAPVARVGDAPAALRARHEELWRRGVDPVSVSWDGGPARVSLRLPAHRQSGRLHARLRLEDGGERTWSWRLENLPREEEAHVEGVAYARLRLDLGGGLPAGYHQLTLEAPGETFEAVLLSAPRQAYAAEAARPPRTWGVFLPLYALQSQHSWGGGDFSDLQTLLTWVGDRGGGLVGTLPLLAAFLDEPCEPSPYSPASRLFWNEFYLDVRRAPELANCPEARTLHDNPAFVQELLELRKAPAVDYRREMALKRRVLAALARSLLQTPSARRDAFAAYVQARPHLADYAAFRATVERRRAPWTEWPALLRDGTLGASDFDEDARDYHLYVQWLAAEQVRELAERARAIGPGLYLDLPLGVHTAGYDVWRERWAFAADVAGGCPPDVVFPKGQNWGFTPLHPEGLRAGNFRYLRNLLAHLMAPAGILRIDHMPSFHRVFWIPQGMEARDGVFVRYPAEELYAVFSLESHRHRTLLVGEDLGTVPPEVPAAMAEHGFQRMYVIQYEAQPNPAEALPEPPAASVASVNTHDMPPFAAYLQAADVRERLDLGLLDADRFEKEKQSREELRLALAQFLKERGLLDDGAQTDEVLRACLQYLAEGPARLMLVNLEDLWRETRSQNVPSTSGESLNWCRKARYSLEEIQYLPEVREALARIDRARRQQSGHAAAVHARHVQS